MTAPILLAVLATLQMYAIVCDGNIPIRSMSLSARKRPIAMRDTQGLIRTFPVSLQCCTCMIRTHHVRMMSMQSLRLL